MRHGPHHGAQKSTSTGTELFRTISSKLLSVTAPTVHPKRLQHKKHTLSALLAKPASSERSPYSPSQLLLALSPQGFMAG